MRDALEFLHTHFDRFETQPDPKLTVVLLKLSERTDSRSVASSALDLLVNTGVISEFEALNRLGNRRSLASPGCRPKRD